jgi:dihydroorotase
VPDVIWIRSAARLLDPASGVDRSGDLWIRRGRIAGVGEAPPPELRGDALVIDATGALVTPMFLDLHVHFREPGGDEAETIATGVASALAGGYAAVYAMPNTQPACDRPEAVAFVRERAAAAGGDVDVVPVSALSRGLCGAELVDLSAMQAAGAGAFSDDGLWLADQTLAEEAFRWAAEHDAVIMQHCEVLAETGAGVLHDAPGVRLAGFAGIPRRAEDEAVLRDIALARRHGTRLHVCHVSTSGAAEAIRQARAGGVRVSGEVAPHHLLLTVEDALEGGADWKMKPPLREAGDLAALVAALADGTLEAVATDHAPHADHRKACGLACAPFGAIGLETAFPALYTRLVATGKLALERLVEAVTSGPARIVGRPPLRLAVGSEAAVNVLDVTRARRVDRASLASRSHNTPFHGQELSGWPLGCVRHGRWLAARR